MSSPRVYYNVKGWHFAYKGLYHSFVIHYIIWKINYKIVDMIVVVNLHHLMQLLVLVAQNESQCISSDCFSIPIQKWTCFYLGFEYIWICIWILDNSNYRYDVLYTTMVVGEHEMQTFKVVIVMLLIFMLLFDFLSSRVHICYYFWTSDLSKYT